MVPGGKPEYATSAVKSWNSDQKESEENSALDHQAYHVVTL